MLKLNFKTFGRLEIFQFKKTLLKKNYEFGLIG